MTALPRSRTTIGQLVYPDRPALNFARLVSDLDAALLSCDAGERRATVERDGLAVIDAGGSRIAVAMAEDLDPAGAAAITVTVGFGPEEDGDARLARRQAALARMIVDRVVARTAPAETIWSESEEVATPEFLERSSEELAARQRAMRDSGAEQARTRRVVPAHFVETTDLPRMMARVEATLEARRMGQDDALIESRELPAVDLGTFEEAPEGDRVASAPLRLAAYLIDAMLMLLLLPVGAAMMIYSLSRGANLNTSARAMAATGAAVALWQQAGGDLATIMTLMT